LCAQLPDGPELVDHRLLMASKRAFAAGIDLGAEKRPCVRHGDDLQSLASPTFGFEPAPTVQVTLEVEGAFPDISTREVVQSFVGDASTPMPTLVDIEGGLQQELSRPMPSPMRSAQCRIGLQVAGYDDSEAADSNFPDSVLLEVVAPLSQQMDVTDSGSGAVLSSIVQRSLRRVESSEGAFPDAGMLEVIGGSTAAQPGQCVQSALGLGPPASSEDALIEDDAFRRDLINDEAEGDASGDDMGDQEQDDLLDATALPARESPPSDVAFPDAPGAREMLDIAAMSVVALPLEEQVVQSATHDLSEVDDPSASVRATFPDAPGAEEPLEGDAAHDAALPSESIVLTPTTFGLDEAGDPLNSEAAFPDAPDEERVSAGIVDRVALPLEATAMDVASLTLDHSAGAATFPDAPGTDDSVHLGGAQAMVLPFEAAVLNLNSAGLMCNPEDEDDEEIDPLSSVRSTFPDVLEAEEGLHVGNAGVPVLPFDTPVLDTAELTADPEVEPDDMDPLSSMASAFPDTPEIDEDWSVSRVRTAALPLESACVEASSLGFDHYGSEIAVDGLDEDPVTSTPTFPDAPESDDGLSLSSAHGGAAISLEDAALESAGVGLGEYDMPTLTAAECVAAYEGEGLVAELEDDDELLDRLGSRSPAFPDAPDVDAAMGVTEVLTAPLPLEATDIEAESLEEYVQSELSAVEGSHGCEGAEYELQEDDPLNSGTAFQAFQKAFREAFQADEGALAEAEGLAAVAGEGIVEELGDGVAIDCSMPPPTCGKPGRASKVAAGDDGGINGERDIGGEVEIFQGSGSDIDLLEGLGDSTASLALAFSGGSSALEDEEEEDEEEGSASGAATQAFYEDEDTQASNDSLPPPTCSPPPSPPSPPPTPAGGQYLIREGSDRGDFLKFFASGESFASAYQVGRKIGEGGFGKVFMAEHRILGVSRAVKRLSKTHGKTDSHKNELAALFALDHPHIVKLVEYYEEQRYLYLVFELCTGPDLFDRVSNEPSGRMSELDASVALRHMLKALQCCHSKYRGHFDIKPENFMYSDKDLVDLKMIDLGMSSGYDLHRRKHKIKGTAAYMAPELWRGTYGPEADIWSCGVVLFVMITGEPALPDLAPATMKCESKLADLLKRRMRYATSTFNLSAKAQDLLGLMLKHDRHARPTVREALKHPFCNMSYENEHTSPHWIPDANFREAQRILKCLPETFRGIAEEPMLKRVARIAMAHVGEAGAAEHLAFRMLDWYGYGELSVSVIESTLKAREVEIPDDLDQLFEAIDLLREGYISYLTFLSVTLPLESRRNENLCRIVFRILDRDRDGFIDTQDLTSVFGNEHVCRGILNEVSFEARLSLQGFLQMMQEDVRMSDHPFCWCR